MIVPAEEVGIVFELVVVVAEGWQRARAEEQLA